MRGHEDIPRGPLELTLELARAENAGEPFAFHFHAQDYRRRLKGGAIRQAHFSWNEQLRDDLANLQRQRPDAEGLQRLGDTLRGFLDQLDWAVDEKALETARAAGREVHVTIRSAAVELYFLPWELLTLRDSGERLGELESCIVRYEWASPPPVISPGARAHEATRILFAWSAAGGAVPQAEHQKALCEACERWDHPFDLRRDVLAHTSVKALSEALEGGEGPPAVLHVLCHGGKEPHGTSYGLLWNGEPGSGEVDVVTGDRLRQLLKPHAGSLKLVVLCACKSGGVERFDSHLGSVALALHRAGIPAVVASRLPLSVEGSVVLARTLYGRLLGEGPEGHPASLQQALATARRRLLQQSPPTIDWAALQLYARADAGSDLRPLPIRPYRGLLTFEAKHRRFFFGRKALERELLERLLAAMEGKRPRFQVVAGASGSGKSSLVLAGLVPRLPEAVWDVQVLRPSDAVSAQASEPGVALQSSTLRLLARLLHGLHSPDTSPGFTGTQEEVLEEARGLRQARPGRELLLVVDQLEEMFIQLPKLREREAFIQTLWRLAGARELGLLVLCTLRVDAFEHCGGIRVEEHRWLDSIVYDEAHRLFISPIHTEQLDEIIEAPARKVGLEFQQGLLMQLKRDVSQEPGALPLLEHALDLLWQKRDGHWLTWVAYYDMKEVSAALASTGDSLYESLSCAEQRQARRLVVRLVASGDTKASRYVSRRVRLADVRPTASEESARAAFDAVVRAFVDHRLLVTGRDEKSQGHTWIEVAHDALLHHWKKVEAWMTEDWKQERQVRELEEWAKQWRKQRFDVLTGRQLGYAQRIRDKDPGALPPSVLELLEQSEKVQRRQEEEKQKQLEDEQELRRQAEREREEALRQRTAALDAARVSHARRLLLHDPTLAALILREVVEPEEQWCQAAVDVLRRACCAVVLEGHGDELNCAAFSPDGTRVVTASKDGTARVWRADGTGAPLVLRGHGSEVSFAAFCPDGTRVVTASRDKTARVWRVEGGEASCVELRGHGGEVGFAAFSPDGTRVVTASKDGTARVWRTDRVEEPVVLKGLTSRVNAAVFSPDGTRVVTGSRNGLVRVWRADGAGEPVVLNGHGDEVNSVAFSPDGTWVVTASADGTARVWRVEGGGAPVVLEGHGGAVNSAAFSPDGTRVVTASDDGTAWVWRANGVEALLVLEGHGGVVNSAAFSSDGTRVVTASGDGLARVWRVEGLGAGEPILLEGHNAKTSVRSAAFSPDGKWVVTASLDGTARVWRADGGQAPLVLQGHEGGVRSMVLSPDGTRVVTASRGGVGRVWQVDGVEAPVLLRGLEGKVDFAAFSPDGTWVVVVSRDGTARVWRADGVGAPIVLEGHEDEVRFAAFSLDGNQVVTASVDWTARVWRMDGAGEFAVLQGHESGLSSAAFSPDGKWVVTASLDWTARVWRADGVGAPVVLRGHQSGLSSAAFSPDGTRVVTASKDGTARVWRVDDWEGPFVLEGHQGEVNSAAFSPDGTRVVTASRDKTARVWRTDGWGDPVVLEGHGAEVNSAAFSPDGTRVVTASKDGTARVWRADGVWEPVVLEGHGGWVGSAVFCPDGTRVVTASNDGAVRIWTVGMKRLHQLLRRVTTVCLRPPLRQRLLGELPEQARTHYNQCERDHGRGA